MPCPLTAADYSKTWPNMRAAGLKLSKGVAQGACIRILACRWYSVSNYLKNGAEYALTCSTFAEEVCLFNLLVCGFWKSSWGFPLTHLELIFSLVIKKSWTKTQPRQIWGVYHILVIASTVYYSHEDLAYRLSHQTVQFPSVQSCFGLYCQRTFFKVTFLYRI